MTSTFSLPYHYNLNYQRNYNILADSYKLIYFNTQKNANSSLKAQFVEILDLKKSKDFPDDVHYNYNFPAVTQDDVKGKYKDYLKIAVLRNPWDRLASCYNNKIRQSSRTGNDYILECHPDLYIGMSFENFVNVICNIPDSEADFHFCSQAYLMLYPDGMLPMNYLCNIENLDFHIHEIKSKTGIPFKTLRQLNKSDDSDYTTLYSASSIEKVRRRYLADIEFFEYKFGEKNHQFSFGQVSNKWLSKISIDPLMMSLIKEKIENSS